MFHQYKKDSSYLRSAIFKAYKEKCAYCGRTIQQRDMQIDHILPSNPQATVDNEVKEYFTELNRDGFIVDSIENYLPSCAACNREKTNQIFKVANLRFYHEMALNHVEKILRLIDKQKTTQETFYEPVNTEIWKEIDFSYQRDLSHAIMGYRLTSADVEACPYFPQVEKIIHQLSIVDYAILEGETGCGKSICIYQVAYEFYKNNWRVYEYNGTEDIDATSIKNNSELSFYLIDDAQRLSDKVINELKNLSRPNLKILLAKTISTVVKQDTILLTNKDAVEIIYMDFLKKKDEIVSIVHNCDNSIGITLASQPIERRLNEAKKAITPWQFNYILRGGWHTMKERYQAICTKNNRSLLVVAIAVLQILKLDNNVDFNWICNELKKIDSSLIWGREDLDYLIDKMILLSEEDLRIVHMESAKVIIALFFKDSSANRKEIILKLIEEMILRKEVSPLGIVWLCNGMSSYGEYEFIITEKMIDTILNDISYIESSKEKMEIAYFIEKVFNMKCKRNGRFYFNKNEAVFLDWIEKANNETAYAYSHLINTLINVDRKKHKEIIKKINWVNLHESMYKEENPSFYSWGQLYNRLIFSLPKKDCLLVGKMLKKSINKFTEIITISNIAELTDFLCLVIYTNPEYIHRCIWNLIPIYEEYFLNNMSDAIYLFSFDFFIYICGINLLGGHRSTTLEKRSSELIVSVLPEKEFSEVIINCQPRDWHAIQPIMYLVALHDKQKARRIVNNIDINKLSEKARQCWESSFEISELCEILYLGYPKVAKKFIANNLDEISTMYSPLISMSPTSGIKAFDKGIKIDLFTERWWNFSFYALKSLYKTDKEKTKRIISENTVQIIEKINTITSLEFEEIYFLKFIQLIKEIDIKIFDSIVDKLDYQQIEKNFNKEFIYKGKAKQIQKRKNQFDKLIKQNL
ncbi:P-loop NTPase [Granulicatella adiacens]